MRTVANYWAVFTPKTKYMGQYKYDGMVGHGERNNYLCKRD